MIEIHYATAKENDQVGWSVRLVRKSDLDPKDTSVYERKNASKGKSGQCENPVGNLYWLAKKISEDQELLVILDLDDRTLMDASAKRIKEALQNRGFGKVEVLLLDEEDHSSESFGYYLDQINAQLKREARAAAWGVRLNPDAYVPGPEISGDKASEVHKHRARNGWTNGGFRLFLAEYGLISAGEITEAIIDKVMQRLYSSTIAEIYNEEYEEGNHELVRS